VERCRAAPLAATRSLISPSRRPASDAYTQSELDTFLAHRPSLYSSARGCLSGLRSRDMEETTGRCHQPANQKWRIAAEASLTTAPSTTFALKLLTRPGAGLNRPKCPPHRSLRPVAEVRVALAGGGAAGLIELIFLTACVLKQAVCRKKLVTPMSAAFTRAARKIRLRVACRAKAVLPGESEYERQLQVTRVHHVPML